MAFERFSRLGPEKFQRIVNELMRGTPAAMVARLIQQEWGDVRDVAEDTLAKQLKRMHAAITNGAFGGDLAEQARRRASVRIKLFHASTLNCLDEMNELSYIQEGRVRWLLEKERASGKRIAAIDRVMGTYMDVLLAIQKMRFDLGLDEYRRGIPVPSAPSNPTSPSGDPMRQRVLEAVSQAEEIFKKCGIDKR